jgi:hypothetical protein
MRLRRKCSRKLAQQWNHFDVVVHELLEYRPFDVSAVADATSFAAS